VSATECLWGDTMTIRTLFASALAGAALLLASSGQPASAITLNAGQSAIFNFDFTANVPPPPYTAVDVFALVSGAPPNGSATYAFFDNLNATGPLLVQIPGITVAVALDQFIGGTTGFIDGIFSVRVTSDNSTFNVDSMSANAYLGGPPVTTAAGTLAGTPLPAALPLFAGGVGAMSVFAWKRKRKSN